MQLALDLRKFGVAKIIDVPSVTSIDVSKIDKNILIISIDGKQTEVQFPDKKNLQWTFEILTNGQIKLDKVTQ